MKVTAPCEDFYDTLDVANAHRVKMTGKGRLTDGTIEPTYPGQNDIVTAWYFKDPVLEVCRFIIPVGTVQMSRIPSTTNVALGWV
jgi:hypothetical protein